MSWLPCCGKNRYLYKIWENAYIRHLHNLINSLCFLYSSITQLINFTKCSQYSIFYHNWRHALWDMYILFIFIMWPLSKNRRNISDCQLCTALTAAVIYCKKSQFLASAIHVRCSVNLNKCQALIIIYRHCCSFPFLSIRSHGNMSSRLRIGRDGAKVLL